MDTRIVLACMAPIAGVLAYVYWLKHSVRLQRMTTRLNVDQLEAVFANTVARNGWTVDGHDPMTASSGAGGGIRTSISDCGEYRSVSIEPFDAQRSFLGLPSQAQGVRFRMNGFVRRVRSMDPDVQHESNRTSCLLRYRLRSSRSFPGGATRGKLEG